ncbi:hypothetical protein RS130_12295 [Paraglaciecola aquimarina]|uniref:Uncharacterized protein n=1 Tax=Paraglaciecola aquimarina TaxID=1235557 RepID=A0ABU3SX54_9ALTE|nr:hypothetical protein [Paraglaciecola aquimarina]MDU0354598.1 hypothetical protein [Paraglaciecola aquimarina]
MKKFLLVILILSTDLHAMTLDVNFAKLLQVPKAVIGDKPSAGKRVVVTPEEYRGTEVYHTIYLPDNWQRAGEKLPIIFEYTGNYYPKSGSSGEVKDAALGYGLSAGKFIWVSLPYIDKNHRQNALNWWGDIEATVSYAKHHVPKIIEQFNGDPDNVFLCGFSRGAIGVNFVGLHDDEISSYWSGFITHDHFDGVRLWEKPWGAPLTKYRKEALQRLKRVGTRPYLVSQNGPNKETENYLRQTGISLNNFTFSYINTPQILGPFPNQYAKSAHTDVWLNVASPYRVRTWNWINQRVKATVLKLN